MIVITPSCAAAVTGLRRHAARLERATERAEALHIDAAALVLASEMAWGSLTRLPDDPATAIEPEALMACADRHAASPRFVNWHPTSADPVAAAREAVIALQTARDELDRRAGRMADQLEFERVKFARAALAATKRHPAIAESFAAELTAVGIQAAGELPDVTSARFRGWLLGAGVLLSERAAA